MNRKQRRTEKRHSQKGTSQRAEALAYAGNDFIEQGKFDEAIAAYKRALVIQPDFAEVFAALGNALKAQGKPDEAEPCYRKAILLKPDLAEAHNNLGTLLKGKDAVASYQRAIEIKPDYAAAYNNLGTAFRTLRDFESAFESYKKALALQPLYAAVYNNIGGLCLDQGKVREAIENYEQALALNPQLVETHNNLGNAIKDTGNLTGAAGCYERAIALKPDYTAGLFNLGSTLAELGKLEEAQPYLQRCLELDSADPFGARLLLAKLGVAEIPERASDAHMQKLYAERAGLWDQTVTSKSLYRGHELVVRTLDQLSQKDGLDILDAGCGTGLVGPLVRNRARLLEGIDLSPAMLERAKEKAVYDRLHAGDLVAFMEKSPQAYDVITCAATLIHFGDLQPVFTAIAKALRPDGLFVATLFPNDEGEGIAVASLNGFAQGGCYAHGRNYLNRLAAAHGLTVEALDTEVHEHRKGVPTMALVMALRK